MNSNKKKFQINEMSPGYRPEEPSNDMAIKVSENLTDYRSGPVFILQIENAARNKIFEHIDWGKRTSKNSVEQGGILLGRVFKKSERNITYGVVTDIVSGTSAQGSAAYLELSTKVWKEMLDQVDRKLEKEGENRNQIIGWYHTHPNSLDVFMSGTDRGTQRRLFANEWHFAIVLNPQRKLWRAFHGPNSSECWGAFDSTTENQSGKPFVESKEPEVKPAQQGASQIKNMRLENRTRKNCLRIALGLVGVGVLVGGIFFSRNVPIESFVRKTINRKSEKERIVDVKPIQKGDEISTPQSAVKDTGVVFGDTLFKVRLNAGSKSVGLQREPTPHPLFTVDTVLPSDTLQVVDDDEKRVWYKVRFGSKIGWVEKKYFSRVLP